MFGYIYKTTNHITSKSYIGKKQSLVFDPKYYGSGLLIQRAIRKYGKNNFTISVLCWCNNLEELNATERTFISECKPEYNLAPGGDGGAIIETLPNRDEIYSKRREGILAWHSGMSPQQKKKWSDSIRKNRKGNFREGYIPTREHREKTSLSNKKAWVEKDNTQRLLSHAKAMALRRGSQTHNSQMIEIDGCVYESLTKAAAALGVVRQTLKNRIQKGQIKCSLIEKQ